MSYSDDLFIGITVNPKNGKPVFVQKPIYKHRTGQIYTSIPTSTPGDFDYKLAGTGYLDTCDSEYAMAARALDIPRVHTPEGVTMKGQGYGTSLYVGMCMLATGRYEQAFRLEEVCGNAAAIHSIDDHNQRSAAAAHWWNTAIDNGLVDEQDVSVEELTEDEDDSVQWSSLSRRARETILETLQEDVDSDIMSIDSADFSVTKRVAIGGGDVTANILTFDTCAAKNLIAYFAPARGRWEKWGDLTPLKPDIVQISKEVILALNLADEDDEITRWIIDAARRAGASYQEIEGMKLRADYRLDPAEPSAQMELFRTGEPSEDQPAPPKSKPIKGKPRPKDTRPSGLVTNPVTLKRRGRVAKNPSGNRREIDRALRQVDERRAELGWDALDDL